ncbi:autophagy-related protein 22-like protein [Xylariomycetidae sp. FL2044]|nr:autophagy-related protein 22-like protein [Xylariomycetidae sp. FL2044]
MAYVHDDKKEAQDTIVHPASGSSGADDEERAQQSVPRDISVLNTRKSFWAWLLICYSTGPTNGVVSRYVPAVLQSVANAVGHKPGTDEPCAKRGKIVCVVPFGAGEVDYNSYTLYLEAIARALEGALTLLISGVADYGHYRKYLMICSIILFGTFALPFASFKEKTLANLNTYAALYLTMNAVSAAYGTMEASYIPLFMRETGWFGQKPTTEVEMVSSNTTAGSGEKHKAHLNRGTKASVLSLVAGNLGSITVLLIALIIANTSNSGASDGYRSFLIAITVGGCLTIVLGTVGWFLIPSVQGVKAPTKNLPWLALRNQFHLLKSVRRYPEPFKLCVGWVLWNTASSNFSSVLGLAFREVTGLGTGDKLYTVYSFMSVVVACFGSLGWMYLYPMWNLKIKTWAYFFFAVHILACFWGCLGIADTVALGYKHTAEFWVELAVLNPATSALRACNRVMYAAMFPRGKEAHFTGLELTLVLATGWINTLVQAVIQDATHNLRYPMLPNLFLFLVALGFYVWFDMEKGMEDSLKPWAEENTVSEDK